MKGKLANFLLVVLSIIVIAGAGIFIYNYINRVNSEGTKETANTDVFGSASCAK